MDGYESGFFSMFPLLFGMGRSRRREDPVLAKVTRWEPTVSRKKRQRLAEHLRTRGNLNGSQAWALVNKKTCRLSHRLKYPGTVRMLAEMEARAEFLEWLRDVG